MNPKIHLSFIIENVVLPRDPATIYNSVMYTRREFLREILYNNIAIIAIHHSKIDSVDTFGNFSHTFE